MESTRTVELTARERELIIKALAMLVSRSADPQEVHLAYETSCLIEGFTRPTVKNA